MSATKRGNVKVFAAIVGGSAVVAIGAMNVALTQEESGQNMAISSTMTIGATSTETTPSAAPAIGEAAPAIKGPAPLPSEEQGLP